MPTGNPTGRPKGQAKTGGRRKGTPNKTTQLLKDAVLRAAAVQGSKLSKDKKHPPLVRYLAWLAKEHPPTFGVLLGRVLPMQIDGTRDEGDEPIAIQIHFVKPSKVIEHAPRFIDPERVIPAGKR